MSGTAPITSSRRWYPIQLGYNPHPFWKFEHLRRYHRILLPICRRRYPVGADATPPPDNAALTRWMDRWDLLPGRVPPALARRLLDTLAHTSVETVKTDALPSAPAGDGLRLPAEWEQSEAVVIAWPVLYPGLWNFHSDLVAAIAPVARVDVLIPHPIYARAILLYLGESWHGNSRIRFLVCPSDDIWVRDYGPLTCIDESGRRVMLDATFDPPPKMPFANDDALPTRYAAHRSIACRHLPLHLEGGNLWSDGAGTLITTTGLFSRNPHLSRQQVTSQLLAAVGATKLIVVPCLRQEDTGHVDVFLKLATADTVLVTEPRSVVNRHALAATIELLGRSRSAAGASYRVLTLPSVPRYWNWGFVRVWPNYANALTINGRVLVPTYRDRERDEAALTVYRRAMPTHEVIGIDASVVANAGGTVHCLTMQIAAEAGSGHAAPPSS